MLYLSRRSGRSERPLVATTAVLLLAAAYAWSGSSTAPTHALPIYARRYNVDCETCHTVVPRLNDFGLAFQANHFNWPAGKPPAHRLGLNAVPISALGLYLDIHSVTGHVTVQQFQSVELFASNGFALKDGKPGGYFVDYFTGAWHDLWGDLNDAYVSVPIGGKHGEFAVTGGQMTPMEYQYDPFNSLTITPPAALAANTDTFSFLNTMPGERLEYFDGRDSGTDDGNYVMVGIPYAGNLAFNRMSHWDQSLGTYAVAFRRVPKASYGLFGYTHDNHGQEGLLGTFQATPKLGLLAAAQTGKDTTGDSHNLSLEADYVVDPFLAVVVQLDSTRPAVGPGEDYPVYTVVYYPARQHVIRVVGETVQDNAARSNALYVFAQL